MTQEETIKIFGNTLSPDETIEYTLSKRYIEDYLKSSNLYLGCSDHRRKTLIEVDLYRLQEAFEDGFKAAVELYKKHNESNNPRCDIRKRRHTTIRTTDRNLF